MDKRTRQVHRLPDRACVELFVMCYCFDSKALYRVRCVDENNRDKDNMTKKVLNNSTLNATVIPLLQRQGFALRTVRALKECFEICRIALHIYLVVIRLRKSFSQDHFFIFRLIKLGTPNSDTFNTSSSFDIAETYHNRHHSGSITSQ